MNSREKGKRGERQWRDVLRAHGYMARRGQQFAGSPDSPDVVCDELKWAHFEVKHVEHLNVYDGMAQAQRDARGKSRNAETLKAEIGVRVPFLCHRRNFWPWLVTMTAETFFRLLRGDFARQTREPSEGDFTEGNRGNEGGNDLGTARSEAQAGPAISALPKAETKNQQRRALTSAATRTRKEEQAT